MQANSDGRDCISETDPTTSHTCDPWPLNAPMKKKHTIVHGESLWREIDRRIADVEHPKAAPDPSTNHKDPPRNRDTPTPKPATTAGVLHKEEWAQRCCMRGYVSPMGLAEYEGKCERSRKTPKSSRKTPLLQRMGARRFYFHRRRRRIREKEPPAPTPNPPNKSIGRTRILGY